jgi:hypothetical protein
MLTEINTITKAVFGKETLQELAADDLHHFLEKYPYSATARYLLAKIDKENEGLHLTASLYINNPLWLDWLLSDQAVSAVAAPEAQAAATDAAGEQPEEIPIEFQSYHTIDYFASQGIRLQQAELVKDRLGQQLKSFTEWLRSMKKLPSAHQERSVGLQDDSTQQHVIRNAEASVQEKDVVTETMAEVWTKQGNFAKAREIYNKLSLLDPSKSAYFAAKIDQLK